MVSFRGRIFHPDQGYAPRALLELRLRAGIGEILGKRQWWLKWTQEDGAIRAKWLQEIEDGVVEMMFTWNFRHWDLSELDAVVLSKFDEGFPTDGTAEEKQKFIDDRASTIEYNWIWNMDWWNEDRDKIVDEDMETFKEKNQEMEATGMIAWYFVLVEFNRVARSRPIVDGQWEAPTDFETASEPTLAFTRQFLQRVRRGELTKADFPIFCPDGDLRPHIVDALWVHVDAFIQHLDAIRACVVRTIDQVIADHALDKKAAGDVESFISPGPIQETWMSDVLVGPFSKAKLVKEVAALENVPEDQKDWHPGSNDQVLDLVHPSLYCCVLGETKCVPSSTSVADCKDVTERMHRIMFRGSEVAKNEFVSNERYQWLPSDFRVDENGHVSIESYINNLHPGKHAGLYESIGEIFEKFVPMFENVLACLANEKGPEPILKFPCGTYDRETHEIPRPPAIPDVLPLQPKVKPYSLKGSTIQVVVKIAEIVLTPENHSYPGGTWHVEGSDTEQLVAAGIYYFGCENISESKLSFRVIVQEPNYQQSDYTGMAAMYGLENEERLVQYLGAATAIEDRCVVFPNTLQHKVEPFELVDTTKPGVRKILAFFLVDPTKKIPSTSTVPPQQREWQEEASTSMLSELQQLPEVIVHENMKSMLGGGMTLEQAKEHREALMDERRPHGDDDDEDEDNNELMFSLCEH